MKYFAIVLVGISLILNINHASFQAGKHLDRRASSADDMPPLRNWVILTDDRSAPSVFGCDQVSIRDDRDLARGVFTGAFSQSPSQIGAAPDGTFIMSLDEGHSGWAHVLTGHPTSKNSWKTAFYQDDFIYGADVEVTLDGQFVLFGYDRGLAKIRTSHLGNTIAPALVVTESDVAASKEPSAPRPQVLPSLDGYLPGVLPASIVLAPDGHTAYVTSVDSMVYEIDIDTMQLLSQPIMYHPSKESLRRRYYSTFATLSPSGRYLIIGVGIEQKINIIDFANRESRLVDIPGAGVVGAVKFNYAPGREEYLAVHGGNVVSLYRFHEERPFELTQVAQVHVPAKSIGQCIQTQEGCEEVWRLPAVAWNGAGDRIIAGIGPVANDWALIRLDAPPTRDLVIESNFRSCELKTDRRNAVGNDVFTFNLIPTYTPIPSDTPTPTTTPSATTIPSATTTASLTPMRSPTPTVTPSPTVTPRPSATPTPSPLYLPLLLRERCLPEQRRVDVALVLDASLSMLEPAGDGSAPGPPGPRSKLDAARGAALAFLDALHLDADRGDQAAVIGFNSSATLLSPLTADRPALDAALAAIAPAPQTCIVCGVDAAAAELASARHRADHAAVLILLTDGRSNPQPAAEAVARAAMAKAAGIRVYTVGLGADLDEAALREMASGPEAYRHAPSAAELGGIYRGIAVDIPCPGAAFWGGR